MPARFPRRLSVLLATAVAVSIATPAWAVTTPEPVSGTRIEDLYADGQRAYEARQYARAGRLWTQALEIQGESPETSTTRANTVNWILLVYTNAYRDSGDAEHLRAAVDVVGSYERKQRELYGERWQLSSDLARRRDEVEALLIEHAGTSAADEARDADEPQRRVSASGSARIEAQGPTESREAIAPVDRRRRLGDDKLFKLGMGLTIGGGAALVPAIWGSAVTVYKARRLRAQIAAAAATGNTQADLLVLYRQGWLATTEGSVALASGVISLALIGGGVAVLWIDRRRGGERKQMARNANPLWTMGPGGVLVAF